MQDVSYVLSELDALNPHLCKPINSTQRIKYTCFDVSSNYIVLGSTSGSIYLFTREPCTFQQLVPLSEGIVSRVTVSPDEKTIALATTRGTVCLVALRPTAKLLAISTEHLSERVNCLCWNDNSSEVYIGDGIGKVSVMVLSIFAVNGIFHAPTCTLMDLDSSIVQLSFSSNLLLISTLTRCYICNTIQEHYKQIGNKARNGEFGACFYEIRGKKKASKDNGKNEDRTAGKRGLFSLMPDGDGNETDENSSKLFCARPGSRLWEVSTNGIVVKTHQFKNVLAIPPLPVYRLHNFKGIPKTHTDQTCSPQSLNFAHLFVISNKYLFTYASSGLYIIDPVNTSVVLWSNEFTNIAMASVVDNKIYLMTHDGEFHCLILYSIDCLILGLYNSKQYQACFQLCLTFRSQLLKSVSTKDISVFCDLDDVQSLPNDEIMQILQPLTSLLQSNLEPRPVKLDSGIVVVNPGKSEDIKLTSLSYSMSAYNGEFELLRSNGDQRNTESPSNLNDDLEPIVFEGHQNTNGNDEDAASSNVKTDTESITESSQQQLSLEEDMHKVQTDLEPIYALINSLTSTLSEEEVQRIIGNISDKIHEVKDTYKSYENFESYLREVMHSVELSYVKTFLDNISLDLLRESTSDCIIEEFLKAFIGVNVKDRAICVCGSPHPADDHSEPKFVQVGKILLEKFAGKDTEKCVYLCTNVPYLWQEYLPIYLREKHGTDDIIRECLRTKDKTVLSIILPLLNTEQWKLVVAHLKRMEENRCLYCGELLERKSAQTDSTINFTDITREILSKDGPEAALSFLTALNRAIPNVPVDRSIFQSLIFTKIAHQYGMKGAVNFNRNTSEERPFGTICSPEIREQLMRTLQRDTGRVINKAAFGSGAYHWGMKFQAKSSTCPCCTLSLETPVLLGNRGIAIFPCGHAYHVNCMIEKKLDKCNLHS